MTQEIPPTTELFSADSLPWASHKRLQQSSALLIGIYGRKEELKSAQEHLEELNALAETHKIPVNCPLLFQVREFCAATFLPSGKIERIEEELRSTGANLIIFDDEITPAQQRNLEALLKVPVIDRTEVILGVFADRAKSHEAKLQIELARAQYLTPRLKRMWTHLSRQSGGGGGSSGGGYLKGEGEKQIEIDRRILKRRTGQLQRELKEVSKYRATQRASREKNAIPVFAIVGYTNAGKSTLMRRLTGADVLVENMLFATLDTTTRKYTLPNNHEVLLVDTVGFIRKLPHQLVAAFKSTLEEVCYADVLLHVVDASHETALLQAATTLEVLADLDKRFAEHRDEYLDEHFGARDKQVITLLNKVDMATPLQLNKLRMSYPRAIEISAKEGTGIETLLEEMQATLEGGRARVTLKIPQSHYQLVTDARAHGFVKHEEYEDNYVLLDVELLKKDAARLQKLAEKACQDSVHQDSVHQKSAHRDSL